MLNIVPNSSWLVKDNKKSIRMASKNIELPLSEENKKIMEKLITFVNFSQDKVKNKDHIVRPAVGLAAPQLGHNINMFYIKLTKDVDNDRDIEYALINCEIIGRTSQKVALKYGEGCLSVDKEYEGYVNRSFKIIVKAYDYFKKKVVKLYLSNYESIVFQHEQDHIEGKLYYDHINKKNPWKIDSNTIYL